MCIHVEQFKITNQICLCKALLKAIIALKLISLTDSQKLNILYTQLKYTYWTMNFVIIFSFKCCFVTFSNFTFLP